MAKNGGRLLCILQGGDQDQVPGGPPSILPEVLDTQCVSPGRGWGSRQSMSWRKVFGTAVSGVWVLKGNARGRMLPANLDHLSVQRRKQGSYDTP